MKIKKLLILNTIFFPLLLFFITTGDCATYYVAQSASGDGSGSSYINRASVTTHNSGIGNFADLSGDTVQLTGKITSQINVKGGSIDTWVSYDGDDGVNPRVELDDPGNDTTTSLNLLNVDYVEIRELYSAGSSIKTFINIGGGCDFIKVHSCKIVGSSSMISGASFLKGNDNISNIEVYDNDVTFYGAFNTIVFKNDAQLGDMSNISVYRNRIEGSRHDALTFINDPNSPYGDSDRITDVYIFENELTHVTNLSGYGRGLDVGATANNRDDGVKNVYIYNNYVHDNRAPVQLGGQNIYVYNNLFVNHRDKCIAVGYKLSNIDPTCITAAPLEEITKNLYNGSGQTMTIIAYPKATNDRITGPINIYNNTIVNSDQAAIGARNTIQGNIFRDINIINNIVLDASLEDEQVHYWDGSGVTYPNPIGNMIDDRPIMIENLTNSTINNNIIYRSDGSAWAFSDGKTELNVAAMNSYSYARENLALDPLFVDPQNGKFNLRSSSPAIGSGATLEQAYSNAFDPVNSRISPYSPKTLKQDNFDKWEIGAFVYMNEQSQLTTLSPPKNLTIVTQP